MSARQASSTDSSPSRGTSATNDASARTLLSGKQKSHLRALAHGIEPVVQMGRQGLTPAVMREIDGALTAHELIKVRLPKEPDSAPSSLTAEIETQLGARTVQHIGHLLLLYRAHPQKPRIILPTSTKQSRKPSNGPSNKQGR